ncbi:MAG: UDP-2,3-diacylglucosamine diphosphatase [Proteobacteria bacterium]|nr:UDP-2,3-diacylglucosamine diphosphatase [Pseudomonadota bacterium]
MAERADRAVYLPGNHDRGAGAFIGRAFAGIEVQPHATHETADGRRLHVCHGDRLEAAVRKRPRLEAVGDRMYGALVLTDRYLHRARSVLGRSYWSLAAYLKKKVPAAVSYIRRFEEVGRREAARHGADGIVCGHIHQPALQQGGQGWYANAGDWVDHCSALVEHHDGRLELLHWAAASLARTDSETSLLPPAAALPA